MRFTWSLSANQWPVSTDRKLKMYFCSGPTFKLGSNEAGRHEQTITAMFLKIVQGSFCQSRSPVFMGVLWRWCKWYYFLNSQLLADTRWDGLMLTSPHPGPCRESWCHEAREWSHSSSVSIPGLCHSVKHPPLCFCWDQFNCGFCLEPIDYFVLLSKGLESLTS